MTDKGFTTYDQMPLLHLVRAITDTKTCRKCGEDKPRGEFNSRSESADGCQSYCRSCDADFKSEWVNRDREYREDSRMHRGWLPVAPILDLVDKTCTSTARTFTGTDERLYSVQDLIRDHAGRFGLQVKSSERRFYRMKQSGWVRFMDADEWCALLGVPAPAVYGLVWTSCEVSA